MDPFDISFAFRLSNALRTQQENKVYNLYGDPTPKQRSKVDEWLKEYIRDEVRNISLGEVEDLLSEVFGIEIPVLKTYRVTLTAVQRRSGVLEIKSFDEEEAQDKAKENWDDADWEDDGELDKIEVETVNEQ